MTNPPIQFQAPYLKGLHTLRFFAALLVILSHLPNAWVHMGYCDTMYDFDKYLGNWLHRGADAVAFFFTLSGFIITYLLIQENHKTQTISLKRFYIRRILRIWPLYFAVMIAGFVLLAYIYPLISHKKFITFPLWEAVIVYMLFLPHYAKAAWEMGLLNPLWSIGVEEEFYLFWAPLVKIFRKNLLPLLLIFTAVSITFYANFRQWNISPIWLGFMDSLKFHYMAVGGLFAYIACFHYEKYKASFWAGKGFQLFIWLFALIYYTFDVPFYGTQVLFLPLMYAFLIMNVAILERPLWNLELKSFTYLGEISYGIYMFHKFPDYFLRFVYEKLAISHKIGNMPSIFSYAILEIGISIVLAHFSYQYFEKYFLTWKKDFSQN